ncbi:MAG: AAA family ATPase [Candidatus Fonsibacter sp.]
MTCQYNFQIIDTEQRDILSAIGTSNAPVHVIHGLAGCGKSMLLQCLVAIYATRHSLLSAADRGAATILLRLQALHHEFLQWLLHNATFATWTTFLRSAAASQHSGSRCARQ